MRVSRLFILKVFVCWYIFLFVFLYLVNRNKKDFDSKITIFEGEKIMYETGKYIYCPDYISDNKTYGTLYWSNGDTVISKEYGYKDRNIGVFLSEMPIYSCNYVELDADGISSYNAGYLPHNNQTPYKMLYNPPVDL